MTTSVAVVPTTVTTATTSMPVQAPTAPAAQVNQGDLVSVFITGAVIAAIVGAIVNVVLARRKSLEEERARVRTTFAEAFQAVAEYKEFPYAIRRRRHDEPEAERVRLSEALRAVQAKLSYYSAWTKAESDEVGQVYATLVAELRKTAGKACHDAWLALPAREDTDMNFAPGTIDLSTLKPYEDAFIAATQKHLREMLRLRRLVRRA
jgi:gas vesicle protein